ncbi:hypothetical protein HVTV-2_gp163 [Haloarcula virus HVTV-2]|uniref:Uncharacterized protein n=1 Tax=Haloarcula vallismortis tailed virus 1 TaxID=1262528 RepID=L7TKM1_9CAUD|nr:hypothetical protein HVTV1_161 [Haloarcula vallismortis tailed virus 1]AGC34530.1 hypothetical protein HVTV1_161 [Haloarcula vallismortis tailed virus 1]UBF22970.1 hypothetical protein HVTV-2_gp163 [Haloarcula virus HVTV-2]
MSTVETDLNDPEKFSLYAHWSSPTVYGTRESRQEQFWSQYLEVTPW